MLFKDRLKNHKLLFFVLNLITTFTSKINCIKYIDIYNQRKYK